MKTKKKKSNHLLIKKIIILSLVATPLFFYTISLVIHKFIAKTPTIALISSFSSCGNGGSWTGTKCCDTQSGTYSDPGPGYGCCWSSKAYSSQTLHDDKTFACIDGQWYYSGHLGKFNSGWTWVKDTAMCQKYGNYSSVSSGWFGPNAYQTKNFSQRDQYLSSGSATNTYCGENKYCNSSGSCVSCGGAGNPCTSQTQNDKKVFGFYFYWYDTGSSNNNYKICGPTFGTSFGYRSCDDPIKKTACSQLSVLEQTPIYGENSFIRWDNDEMYKADFTRLKRSGIDVAVLVGDPREKYDTEAIPHINQALRDLSAQGQDTPQLVLFEALDNWLDVNTPDSVRLLKDSNSRAQLITKITNRVTSIWDKLDDRYKYLYNGKKVLWLFRPPEPYNTELNCNFVSELKASLEKNGQSIFLVGPSSFGNCSALDAYHNWGQGNITRPDQSLATSPAKYISDKIDICEVTPGLERNNAKTCAGDYATFRDFPTLSRGAGDGFRQSWDYCLKNNEGWIVVQTWNEYFESTNIAPSIQNGSLFSTINLSKVNQFKQTSKQWSECAIDAECYSDGVQKQCVNNKCISTQKTIKGAVMCVDKSLPTSTGQTRPIINAKIMFTSDGQAPRYYDTNEVGYFTVDNVLNNFSLQIIDLANAKDRNKLMRGSSKPYVVANAEAKQAKCLMNNNSLSKGMSFERCNPSALSILSDGFAFVIGPCIKQ